VFSVITLQHNPPPIMAWLLSQLLGCLNPGGVAYLQIPSYRSGYLEEDPTPSRISETLTKLEEDLLGRATYPAARRASVVFGEPINASELVRSGALPEKGGAVELTAVLEKKLGELLRGGLPSGLGGTIVPPDA
jgi:hypothetical protein